VIVAPGTTAPFGSTTTAEIEPVTDCADTTALVQPIISKLSVNLAALRRMTEPATNETLRLKLTMAISFFRGWWRTEIACPKQTASGVRDGNLS
jgi:hypothetical protein